MPRQYKQKSDIERIVLRVMFAILAIGIALGFASSDRSEEPSEQDDVALLSMERAQREQPQDTDAKEQASRRILLGPVTISWPSTAQHQAHATTHHRSARYAVAYQLDAEMFRNPNKDSRVVGFLRRGQGLPILRRMKSHAGCNNGTWYQVKGGPYVCTLNGFRPSKQIPSPRGNLATPRTLDDLPFQYAQLRNQNAALYERIPTLAEEERYVRSLKSDAISPPRVLAKRLRGDVFLAVGHSVEDQGRRFWQTIRGRFVRHHDIELLPMPAMRGEPLGSTAMHLPLAFVHTDDATMYCQKQSSAMLHPCGELQKHARFAVDEHVTHEGMSYVQSSEGFLVATHHLRVVEAIERPEAIEHAHKWVHVNLRNQSIVAYEGSTPVYATLISSGKPGYDTPAGTYRIREKYLSTDMTGEDPIDGDYSVSEVPWVLYYHESYALHGAYWHNNFGNVRSHGCTNIAPADAKWLFHWTSPRLPKHWHAVRLKRGTTLHITP